MYIANNNDELTYTRRLSVPYIQYKLGIHVQWCDSKDAKLIQYISRSSFGSRLSIHNHITYLVIITLCFTRIRQMDSVYDGRDVGCGWWLTPEYVTIVCQTESNQTKKRKRNHFHRFHYIFITMENHWLFPLRQLMDSPTQSIIVIWRIWVTMPIASMLYYTGCCYMVCSLHLLIPIPNVSTQPYSPFRYVIIFAGVLMTTICLCAWFDVRLVWNYFDDGFQSIRKIIWTHTWGTNERYPVILFFYDSGHSIGVSVWHSHIIMCQNLW